MKLSVFFGLQLLGLFLGTCSCSLNSREKWDRDKKMFAMHKACRDGNVKGINKLLDEPGMTALAFNESLLKLTHLMPLVTSKCILSRFPDNMEEENPALLGMLIESAVKSRRIDLLGLYMEKPYFKEWFRSDGSVFEALVRARSDLVFKWEVMDTGKKSKTDKEPQEEDIQIDSSETSESGDEPASFNPGASAVYAILNKDPVILKYILNRPDSEINAAHLLEVVMEIGDEKTLEVLLTCDKIDPTIKDNTAIKCACISGCEFGVTRLLKIPAVKSSFNADECMKLCCRRKHFELARMFFIEYILGETAKLDPDIEKAFSQTMLYIAIQYDDAKLFRSIVKKLHAKFPFDNTLDGAAMLGQINIVNLLLTSLSADSITYDRIWLLTVVLNTHGWTVPKLQAIFPKWIDWKLVKSSDTDPAVVEQRQTNALKSQKEMRTAFGCVDKDDEDKVST